MRSYRRKGLTLIEIAIVILLISIIFTGLFTSYTTALQITKDFLPEEGVETSDIFYTINNIRNSFSMAYINSNEERLIFVGVPKGEKFKRKDTVNFSSIHSNALVSNSNEIREVGFYLKKMDLENLENYYYIIRREEAMVDKKPKEGGIEYILLEYVKSLQFKYSRNGKKWQDDWDSKLNSGLPRFIRIEIIALVGKKNKRYETLAFPNLLFK